MVTAKVLPIVLLLASNVFMTFAWYGHLKFTDRPLWLVVIVSWMIASSNIAWRCRPTGSGMRSTAAPS